MDADIELLLRSLDKRTRSLVERHDEFRGIIANPRTAYFRLIQIIQLFAPTSSSISATDELDEAHFPMVQEFPASEEAVPKHASLTAQSSRCSLNELLVDNDRENLHVEGTPDGKEGCTTDESPDKAASEETSPITSSTAANNGREYNVSTTSAFSRPTPGRNLPPVQLFPVGPPARRTTLRAEKQPCSYVDAVDMMDKLERVCDQKNPDAWTPDGKAVLKKFKANLRGDAEYLATNSFSQDDRRLWDKLSFISREDFQKGVNDADLKCGKKDSMLASRIEWHLILPDELLSLPADLVNFRSLCYLLPWDKCDTEHTKKGLLRKELDGFSKHIDPETLYYKWEPRSDTDAGIKRKASESISESGNEDHSPHDPGHQPAPNSQGGGDNCSARESSGSGSSNCPTTAFSTLLAVAEEYLFGLACSGDFAARFRDCVEVERAQSDGCLSMTQARNKVVSMLEADKTVRARASACFKDSDITQKFQELKLAIDQDGANARSRTGEAAAAPKALAPKPEPPPKFNHDRVKRGNSPKGNGFITPVRKVPSALWVDDEEPTSGGSADGTSVRTLHAAALARVEILTQLETDKDLKVYCKLPAESRLVIGALRSVATTRLALLSSPETAAAMQKDPYSSLALQRKTTAEVTAICSVASARIKVLSLLEADEDLYVQICCRLATSGGPTIKELYKAALARVSILTLLEMDSGLLIHPSPPLDSSPTYKILKSARQVRIKLLSQLEADETLQEQICCHSALDNAMIASLRSAAAARVELLSLLELDEVYRSLSCTARSVQQGLYYRHRTLQPAALERAKLLPPLENAAGRTACAMRSSVMERLKILSQLEVCEALYKNKDSLTKFRAMWGTRSPILARSKSGGNLHALTEPPSPEQEENERITPEPILMWGEAGVDLLQDAKEVEPGPTSSSSAQLLGFGTPAAVIILAVLVNQFC